MEVLFISIGRMPFLASTNGIADPLAITPGDLHNVKVLNHDPASGWVFKQTDTRWQSASTEFKASFYSVDIFYIYICRYILHIYPICPPLTQAFLHSSDIHYNINLILN